MNLFTNSHVEEALRKGDYKQAEELQEADSEGWRKGYTVAAISILGTLAMIKVGGAVIRNEFKQVETEEDDEAE